MNMMMPRQPDAGDPRLPHGPPPLSALAVAGRKAVRGCKRKDKAGLPAIPGVIGGWEDLSIRRRGDLRTAVTLLEKAAGKDLAAIAFTPDNVRTILAGTTPAACAVSEATFKAYRGWIRYVLERLGLMQERHRAAGALMPAWQALLDGLTDDKTWIRLRAFIRFCSERTLGPAAVDDAALVAYLEHLRQRDIRGTTLSTVRRVTQAWNRASEAIPGWPSRRLAAPVIEPRQYSLPFTSYPPSLQADVEAFRQRLAGGNGETLYPEGKDDDDAGPPAPLRPGAIRTRMVAVRLLLGAAVQTGTPIDAITSLAVLVENKLAMTTLDWHWRRAGRRTTDHTGVLSDTLRVIAKYHVRLPAGDLSRLLPVLRKAKPRKRNAMTEKNTTVLRELADPIRRAKILHLPAQLMRLAARAHEGRIDARGIEQAPRPLEAARIAALAAAIEIELHAPMRIENLSRLRFGLHLKKLGAQRQAYALIAVPSEETKTGVAFEWPLEKDTAQLLADYAAIYRPALPNAAGDWLLPSKTTSAAPRTKGGLSTAITEAIHRHVGVRMTVHQFRAFAGALILEENPHALEDLRLILGHATLETALIYYKAWAPKEAAARFGRLITTKRGQTRLLAEAAFGTSRRRRKAASNDGTVAA